MYPVVPVGVLALLEHLGELGKVPRVPLDGDKLLVVVVGDAAVLGVPGHEDDLGSVQQVGREHGQGQVGLDVARGGLLHGRLHRRLLLQQDLLRKSILVLVVR